MGSQDERDAALRAALRRRIIDSDDEDEGLVGQVRREDEEAALGPQQRAELAKAEDRKRKRVQAQATRKRNKDNAAQVDKLKKDLEECKDQVRRLLAEAIGKREARAGAPDARPPNPWHPDLGTATWKEDLEAFRREVRGHREAARARTPPPQAKPRGPPPPPAKARRSRSKTPVAKKVDRGHLVFESEDEEDPAPKRPTPPARKATPVIDLTLEDSD